MLVRPEPKFLPESISYDAVPWYFSRGSGAHLYDSAGKDYLDLTMARGAVILGYNHKVTAEMFERHTNCVMQSSLRHHAEVEVAEKIVELVPCAEKVVFGKNGSDACTGAVRLARAATGRNTILSCGYHGFQDWFASTLSGVAGFPKDYSAHIHTFELNDYEKFNELISAYRHDLAAIIVEPAHRTLPWPGFLEMLRQETDASGAILIFDEVVTGFRVHLGGWQAISGVIPDLVCLGKAMTNGYPLSALAGRGDVMRELKKTFFSMTYQTDSFGFILALACLRYLQQKEIPAVLTKKGEMLRAVFDEAAQQNGLPALATGISSRLELDFPPVGNLSDTGQKDIFLSVLSENNIIPTTTISVCEEHTNSDIDYAGKIFMTGMFEIQKALNN